MIKAGDKITINGEEAKVIHVSPSYPAGCDHEWTDQQEDSAFSGHCLKCGMSFARHVFMEAP